MPKGIPKNGINKGWFKKGKVGFWQGKKRPNISGKNHFLYGRHRTEEVKEKMRKKLRGRTSWNKGLKGTCKSKWKGKTVPWLQKYQYQTGKLHPYWKGGKSRPHHAGKKYIVWRTMIFLRDNFTCMVCGQIGGYLEAHHIKSWTNYLKLRYKIDNGITLCLDCHKLANKIQRQLEKTIKKVKKRKLLK